MMIRLILLLTVLLAGCTQPTHFYSTDLTGNTLGADFALTDQNGKPRRLADFRDKAVVVFFGYTQCPDVCPTTLGALREVMTDLGPQAERVQVVFITLDPERDTEKLLAEYVPAFHASFLGLRGDAAATAATAQAFKVFYKKQPGPTADAYTIDHSTGSYIYDPQGRLRLYMKYGETPAHVASDIRQLLAGK